MYGVQAGGRISTGMLSCFAINLTLMCNRAFVSTRSLVHKHVKISVGKWIMETTLPHKHVHITEDQIFLSGFVQHDHFPIILYLKLFNSSDFTINSS